MLDVLRVTLGLVGLASGLYSFLFFFRLRKQGRIDTDIGAFCVGLLSLGLLVCFGSLVTGAENLLR